MSRVPALKVRGANLGLALVSFLVTLGILFVVGELYLRWRVHPAGVWPSAIPGLTYEMLPNQTFTQLGVEYRINRHGFRGDDFPVTKPPGEFRILFLGDSIVYGARVREDEGVAAQLQKIWRRDTGSDGVRVINAGVSSYSILDYLAMLRYHMTRLDPDLVLIGLFMNDHAPYLPSQTLRRLQPPSSWWRRSYLLNQITTGMPRFHTKTWLVTRTGRGSSPTPELASYFPDDPESVRALTRFAEARGYSLDDIVERYLPVLYDLEAWTRIREPLGEMRQLVSQGSGRLVVIVFPVEFQIYEGFISDQPQRLIRETCTALGIEVLDTRRLLAELQARLRQSIYPHSGDMMHFSAAGHRALAEAIYARLHALGVSARAGKPREQPRARRDRPPWASSSG